MLIQILLFVSLLFVLYLVSQEANCVEFSGFVFSFVSTSSTKYYNSSVLVLVASYSLYLLYTYFTCPLCRRNQNTRGAFGLSIMHGVVSKLK